jgi:hypothetical protein
MAEPKTLSNEPKTFFLELALDGSKNRTMIYGYLDATPLYIGDVSSWPIITTVVTRDIVSNTEVYHHEIGGARRRSLETAIYNLLCMRKGTGAV